MIQILAQKYKKISETLVSISVFFFDERQKKAIPGRSCTIATLQLLASDALGYT